MANDTDNNFLVTGATQNANIATDYSVADAAHYQVVKVSFGDVGVGGTRVTSSVGLPVDVVSSADINVTSITNPVTVSGSMAVYGINGATAIAVTASNFGIRALTAGNPASGLAPGADFVRVVGYSGGYAVGVTASDLDIRNLTAGTVTVGDPSASSVDMVRVVGYSGGYPIAITGASFDIRGLTYTKDSVSVFNTVSVQNGGSGPFSTAIADGFQTRLLRANTGGVLATSKTDLSASWVEDTVRVVGLSGAYPVYTVPSGLTNISNPDSRIPFHVDTGGNLYVTLAAGTIGVTAQISGSNFVLTGVSLAEATSSTMTIQVNGYTGSGARLIGVTATDLDIRNLSWDTDSVTAAIRVLSGVCGDEVGITGSAWNVLYRYNTALADVPSENPRLRTDDANGANIKNALDAIGATLNALAVKVNRNSGLGNGIEVSVVGVAQPSGITSGRVLVTGTPTAFGSFTLTSGVHLKADIANNNSTPIFVGAANAVTTTSGFPLYNGDQIFIETDNTSKIGYASAGTGLTLYYVGT